MTFRRAAFIAPLVAMSSFLSAFTPAEGGKVLFCIHRGEERLGLERYLQLVDKHHSHDYALLREMGLLLLQKGARSEDPETTLMTLFGAGASLCPSLIPIFEAALGTKDQRHQLLALQFLSRLQEDKADKLIQKALTSPFLLTRLEAAFFLAKKGDRGVMAHIESLLGKVPAEVRALLPQILVHLEEPRAKKMLTAFLQDQNQLVRIQTLLQLGQAHRDDFLLSIRALKAAKHPIEQQSVAATLALLKDHGSLPYFKRLSQSDDDELKLAALAARISLGEREQLKEVEKLAKKGNLFAIALLGKYGSKCPPLLHQLSHSTDLNIKLNALLARLQLKDPSVVLALPSLLITEARGYGFAEKFSAGGALKAWQIVPSVKQHAKKRPQLLSSTIQLKEHVLREALELPEEAFLALARQILDRQVLDLVPLLMEFLINHESAASLALLKEYSQKAGAPLIRNYCYLALYRLHVPGPYEEYLKAFVEKSYETALISFREDKRAKPTVEEALASSTLTPQESSALLISTLETFASTQNVEGIEILLKALVYGNPKNRYALAGLLIRTAE